MGMLYDILKELSKTVDGCLFLWDRYYENIFTNHYFSECENQAKMNSLARQSHEEKKKK